MIQQEPPAAIGEFTAMIVHEMRTPLSTVSMTLEQLAGEQLSERTLKRLEIARREGKRLEALVSELLMYAKPQNLCMELLNVGDLLREAIGISAGEADDQRLVIEYNDAPEPVFTLGDHAKLTQAFINLLSNAREAVSSPQTVRVSVGVDELTGTVRVEVRNAGYVPREALGRLTEPFYTTKAGGTGLGLCIVQRIVDAHNGHLEIRSNPDEDVCVTVRLAKASGTGLVPFGETDHAGLE